MSPVGAIQSSEAPAEVSRKNTRRPGRSANRLTGGGAEWTIPAFQTGYLLLLFGPVSPESLPLPERK